MRKCGYVDALYVKACSRYELFKGPGLDVEGHIRMQVIQCPVAPS